VNARNTNEPAPDPSQEGNSASTGAMLLPSFGGVRGGFSRRTFLMTTGMAAVAVGGIAFVEGRAAQSSLKPKPISIGLVDTNVALGRWPFRRLPLDDTPGLVARLQKLGVTQCWAGSFAGLLHRDIAGVNARLVEECRKHGRGLLVPFGSVNPMLPDWEEDLGRCHAQYKMPGIRLHPNYHGYKLDAPVFVRLLHLARANGLVVQIAVSMEDERMHHALARVADVDLSLLPALIKDSDAPRLVLLNWYRAVKGDLLKSLADTGNAWFDVATVEGVGGIANVLTQIPASRVVFGSHAPFFYYESAWLKLAESALSQEQTRAICADNARRVWSHS